MVRKIPTFTCILWNITVFLLTKELTIKIKNMKGLGKLIDAMVSQGEDLVTLKEFKWKSAKVVRLIFLGSWSRN